MKQGRLFVISAPSGTGKTTVVNHLRRRLPALRESISVTTRAPRTGEKDGADYHFVDQPTFQRMIADNAFLEWAEVFGHSYGTPRAPLDAWRTDGEDVILDIDVQGARSVRHTVPDAVLVFLCPPSLDVLEQRLRARGTEDEATLQRRLARAKSELDERKHYDHVITNESIDNTVTQVVQIIQR